MLLSRYIDVNIFNTYYITRYNRDFPYTFADIVGHLTFFPKDPAFFMGIKQSLSKDLLTPVLGMKLSMRDPENNLGPFIFYTFHAEIHPVSKQQKKATVAVMESYMLFIRRSLSLEGIMADLV